MEYVVQRQRRLHVRGRSWVRIPPTALCAKNAAICDFGGADGWLAGGVLPELFFLFSIFKISFLKNSFLGKLFAVCPINGTWQRASACLPCATHGKGIAVCRRHTANQQHPLVTGPISILKGRFSLIELSNSAALSKDWKRRQMSFSSVNENSRRPTYD